MADHLGMSMRSYCAYEMDRRKPHRKSRSLRTFRGMLRDYEICYLLRRRAKVTREWLGPILGLTPAQITKIERGESNVHTVGYLHQMRQMIQRGPWPSHET